MAAYYLQLELPPDTHTGTMTLSAANLEPVLWPRLSSIQLIILHFRIKISLQHPSIALPVGRPVYFHFCRRHDDQNSFLATKIIKSTFGLQHWRLDWKARAAAVVRFQLFILLRYQSTTLLRTVFVSPHSPPLGRPKLHLHSFTWFFHCLATFLSLQPRADEW